MTSTDLANVSYLYVEDDYASRVVVRLLFKNAMGIKDFFIFESSLDFMERIRALPRRPQIILLDVQVQPYDGFEMLRMLRMDPLYCHTKVVALTASVMSEEVEKLRMHGFDGALGKPIRASCFPKLMARVLQGEAVWQI